MMVDGHSRAALAQRVLVALFLTAACEAAVGDDEPQETYDEPVEEREALECDIQLACGEASSEAECRLPWRPSGCTEIDDAAFEACISAMRDVLADIEDGTGICQTRDYGDACNEWELYADYDTCATTAGRPLYIDGEQTLPIVVRTGRPAMSPRACAAEHWLRCAQLEAASVPAFRRLQAELGQLGAPPALRAAARQAAEDEVVHTRLCLAQANAMSDAERFSLRPMPRVAARPDVTLEQLAVEALLEGCVAEGAAAAWAAIATENADAEPATVLQTIAADELRHATLSWRVIGWALCEQPSIAGRLQAALEAWQHGARSAPQPPGREDLARFGVLSATHERAITAELVEKVVRPTLQALCRRRMDEAARA